MLFIDSRKGRRSGALCVTKIILVMRWTAALLLAACLQVSARGYSQQITLSVESVPLKKVFMKIQQQTGLYFLCDEELMDKVKPVTLKVSNLSLDSVLSLCFNGVPFRYSLVEKTIVINKKQAPPPARNMVAASPDSSITITGQVLDAKGVPVIGTTIKLKGTGTGTTTDQNGRYILKLPGSHGTLSFSSIGYQPKEVPVDNRRTIDMILLEDNKALGEVVVRAFGTQRKIETLGAQSTLSVKELKQPVANITTVLAGRISGLVGVQRSAEPGLDNADLWVRGVATFDNNSSKPLILVDGVERSFNNLDPNDIESFTILKDASSTAVYGVRGANGVILITTKRGTAGKTSINVDAYTGITEFTRIPEVSDGVTYMQMANEANVTRGGNPIYSQDAIHKTYTQEDPYLYPDIDWFKQVFNRFGRNSKANINIGGGSDKMTYYVSAGYYDEKGLFKTDGLQKYDSKIGFTRYNFSSALTIKATKSTNIDLGIKGWIANGNYPGTGTADIFKNILAVYPILYPLSYPNGVEPFTSTGGGLAHPLGLLTNRGYVSTFSNQINSDIRITQDLAFLLKGLSARVLYSFDAANDNRLARKKTPGTTYVKGRDADGNLIYSEITEGKDYLDFSRTSGGSRQFYLESAITYDNTFGKHHVGALALYNQNDRVDASATDLIGSLPYRSLGAVGRVNYAYNDRYLVEASFGYNGAENFAPRQRFGFFPSAALGWVVSNEHFFRYFDNVLQLFKLRASYGLVGNSNIVGRRFAYVASVANTTGYSYGQDRNNKIDGLDIGDYAATVSWEKEKDLNLGVELTTFHNALNLQVDWFTRRRENIFLQRAGVPSFVGLRSNLLGNLGITSSKGVDITGEYNTNFGQFSMQVRGTLTYNKNEVIENDKPTQPYSYMETRGHSINQRFGYIALGYYTEKEIADPGVARTTGVVQAGDIKFKDLNNDGVIDANDVTAIGKNLIPQIVYGFGATMGYKGFSLGAFFQGVDKVDLYLSKDFMPFRNGSARGSLYSNIKDRWTPDNPRQDAFYPRLAYGSDINQNYSANSTHWLSDGRFLRLKTLDFGYTLQKGALGRYGVQKLRIYFIGYNLLTFSPFKMYDPEMGDSAGTNYPNIKTYSIGFNVSF
jgi:TonB-linked SusC/RagA family outer membrane protein